MHVYINFMGSYIIVYIISGIDPISNLSDLT